MTRIETPAHSDSQLPGVSGLVLSSSSSDSGSVEAISTTTLHGMLVQVLEQTAALWKTQAATNHILDELRQSIAAPQESADMHERLCHVEILVERLTHGQHTGLHPPSQSNLISTQETARVSPISHPGGRQDKDRVSVARVIPPSAHGDLLITRPVISPEQANLPLRRSDSVPPMPGGNESMGTSHSRQDPLEESNRKPSLPRSFQEHGTVEPSRSCVKGSNSRVSVGDQNELVQGHECLYTNCDADSMRSLSFAADQGVPTAKRNEARDPGIERADITYKHDITAERRDLLQTLSDAWRADIRRLKDEIISAVRTTALEQVPYNIHGYLDEFSKGLATEVRSLLNEVSVVREERQRIRHGVGYPMTMQSTFSPGEFGADRLPDYSSPTAPAGIPFTETPIPRPAWRTLPPRGNRHSRKGRVPPPPPPPPVRRESSWVTWQPNPLLAPTPPPGEPTTLVPDRGSPGLFGPRSPRDSYRELPSPSQQPENGVLRESAWAGWDHLYDLPPLLPPISSSPGKAWDSGSEDGWIRCYQPSPHPALAPSPPFTEPVDLVPDRTSPGLFGPRSPCDSYRELPEQNADLGFGPRSPRDSYRELPRQIEQPENDASRAPLRVAWEPSSLPPPVEPGIRVFRPTVPVRERRNPKLFGSPRHVPWTSDPCMEPDIPDVHAWLRQVRHESDHSSLFGPSYPDSKPQ